MILHNTYFPSRTKWFNAIYNWQFCTFQQVFYDLIQPTKILMTVLPLALAEGNNPFSI